MNRGPPGPRISLRLWFSITMVNTVPPQPGRAIAGLGASARHDASVVPELLGVHAALASTATIVSWTIDFMRPQKLESHSVSCKPKSTYVAGESSLRASRARRRTSCSAMHEQRDHRRL